MEHLKQFRSSVSKNFDELFDSVYKVLHAEIAARDARVLESEERASAIEEARVKACSRVKELERQIEDFQCRQSPSISRTEGTERSNGSSCLVTEEYAPQNVFKSWESHISKNSNLDLYNLLGNIHYKYHALYDAVHTLEGAMKELKTQAKRSKKKLQQWHERVQCNEFSLILDGTTVKFSRMPEVQKQIGGKSQSLSKKVECRVGPEDRAKTMPLHPQHAYKGGVALSEIDSNTLDPAGATLEQGSALDSTSLNSSSPDGRNSTHIPPHGNESSQVKTGLKRKRTVNLESPSTILPHTSTIEVKPESISMSSEKTKPSSLQNYQEHRAAIPTGTQDLDDIGITVETPMKKRISDGYQNHSKQPESNDHEASSFDQEIRANRYSEKLRLDWQLRECPTPLQPANTNARMSNNNIKTAGTKERTDICRASARFHFMTEDGEKDYSNNGQERLNETSTKAAAVNPSNIDDDNSVHRRLSGLLASPLPSKRPLAQFNDHNDPRKPADLIHESSYSVNQDHEPPKTVSCTVHADSSQSRNDSIIGRRPEGVGAGQDLLVCSKDGPLRVRSPRELNPECFRLNPDQNNGLEFAYGQVIRNKAERQHLAGCMRPGCCGDVFRAMARLKPQTGSDQEEDQRLLEEYMGKDSHSLDQLSEESRKKLILEARARSLANNYGKHRHQHQRAHSPPGFWRTEMPDTQELENDRQEARRLEHETVTARRQEAMRPGGLWQFADE
ncbi:hypothetical protein ASPZODRAFT_135683 [Penicilliopsis zonata CBS 506.65]|uniref:DNA endonuclease activator Ctp1 C-terminal domain-containing protein n=1 Tax=Penicilliopsis zonata CBS 506.65 TaxID=1073090 RepID=A0A1L9SAI8_9EURO|nr:hypothetical protein ASPZODRAFT_135683 [Penicilliopsis zonata CBS 506.65]OJJ44193.1 hypothetical protein ASPZODRAFT_135683 [Penicilliopsis zonata CBS 506.65]